MENECLLRMEHISKRFTGVQALNDVSFEVYPGEVVGLVGENGAGKSTLLKILSGVHSKDEGKIFFEGREIEPGTPQDAQQIGIITIYQELAVILGLDVASNIFLHREPCKFGIINMLDRPRMRRDAETILKDLGLNLRVTQSLQELPIASQQMVEIARAVSQDARLILMDEPTSALSGAEVEMLFNIIQRLKSRGVSVVFVSHRLDEVLHIVDRIVVLRDGQRVANLPVEETTQDIIVRNMVGRNVNLFPREPGKAAEVVLDVRNLSGGKYVRDVALCVRKGEIVGLAGLIGAGRTEMARMICGADPYTKGEIFFEGRKIRIDSPADAVKNGIAYVPEDRKLQGLLMNLDVKDNITITILKQICNRLFQIQRQQQANIASHYVKTLSIATPKLNQMVGNLSGGNQQKVVLAKWLCAHPKVLILDEPTRGIDVGAKAEVHALMNRLAHEGMAILMISSELPEILGMSDRIIVMCQGRVTGEFSRDEASQEAIMTCATQFANANN